MTKRKKKIHFWISYRKKPPRKKNQNNISQIANEKKTLLRKKITSKNKGSQRWKIHITKKMQRESKALMNKKNKKKKKKPNR